MGTLFLQRPVLQLHVIVVVAVVVVVVGVTSVNSSCCKTAKRAPSIGPALQQ